MSNKSIKVDSLSYYIEFKNNEFKVGCQTLRFEDARKVAEFILKQKKTLNVRFQVGGVYKCKFGVYVLCQIGRSFCLQKLTESVIWIIKPSREGMQNELNKKNFEFMGDTVDDYYRELYNRT